MKREEYMTTAEEFKGQTPAWCPGCGNFSILKTFREALSEMRLEPHLFTMVSGIGQASKLPHYLKCNTFNGLHGRSLPVATGIRLANHKMPVIAIAGDGDCYGEGGNHLIHAMRRNINVKLFVHNNQIYGLTKGQASPTSVEGMATKIQPSGVLSEQLNPLALAISLDCSFVARSFAGDARHLKDMIKQAFVHKGFSLVDILQPCVTFNKLNTYEWYRSRVYQIESGYDQGDRMKAFERSLEWQERIPIGVIYKNGREPLEKKVPVIREIPLVKQGFERSRLEETLKEFY